MKQEKTGLFIATLRKEKRMTQKDLADQLNVTDKAVSKWECGYSLPDYSVMLKLCSILDVSVNELLSGERLSSTEYNKKAEENIMTLIHENHENKKSKKQQLITSTIMVILLLVYLLWSLNRSTENALKINYFIDFIALNIVIIIPLIMLILAKQFTNFLNIIKFNFKKQNNSDVIRDAKNAASFTMKSVMLSGGICSIIYVVNWVRCIDNAAYWGPNLAKIILGLFYSLIISCILLILKERI